MPGRNAGLPAHADGGLLPQPRDHPQLPGGDRAPLLRPAPQRAHAALPDEGGTGGEGQRRAQLPAGGKGAFLTSGLGCGAGKALTGSDLPLDYLLPW